MKCIVTECLDNINNLINQENELYRVKSIHEFVQTKMNFRVHIDCYENLITDRASRRLYTKETIRGI